jgi:hypothetical protein
MRKILLPLFALACLALPTAARADLLIEIQHHRDGHHIMRQKIEPVDEVVKQWIGSDRAARWASDMSTVVRLDLKKLYLIRHADKAYSSIDLPLDLSASLAPEMQQAMKAMGGMFKFDATVTPTSENKTINGFPTQLYKVSISGPMGMKIDQNMWVSKDLNSKLDLGAYRELFGSQMAMLGPMGGDWWKKLMVIDGFPVLTEVTTTMGGNKFGSRDEVKTATETAPPAGTYEPPAGYKEERFDPMRQGQRR